MPLICSSFSVLGLAEFAFLIICQTTVRLGRACWNHIMLSDCDSRGLQTSVVAHALLDSEESECWVVGRGPRRVWTSCASHAISFGKWFSFG